jgi:hypothetical protein
MSVEISNENFDTVSDNISTDSLLMLRSHNFAKHACYKL